MEQKLTPWFPPEVKPVRVGVYLATVTKIERYYRLWNGEDWCIGGDTPREAATNADYPLCIDTAIYWRGLAKPPKGAA